MSSKNKAGAEARRAAQGPKSERLQEGVMALDQGVAEWVDEFVFGTVWQRDGLSHDDRMLIAISVLAAGQDHDQLKAYLFGALHKGMSARRIQEALVMLAVYRGFPSAIQGLTVFRTVMDACRAQGVALDVDE